MSEEKIGSGDLENSKKWEEDKSGGSGGNNVLERFSRVGVATLKILRNRVGLVVMTLKDSQE